MKTQGGGLTLSGKGYRIKLQLFGYKVLLNLMGFAESLFGPASVPLFTVPLIGLDLARREHDFPTFIQFRTAMSLAFWKGLSDRAHYRKMVRDWVESGVVVVLCDRLGLPRWQKRFQVKGPLPQSHPDWGKRPVVFAFFHSGAFGLIRHWLRSQRIPTASLVGGIPLIVNNDTFREILATADQRDGLVDVPHIFQRYDNLREVIRYLTPGRAITVALDGGKRNDEVDCYDAGGFPVMAKRGAFRIAAQTNAIVIPIAVRRTGMCRFEIHYGNPVPDEFIRNEDLTATTQHLVSQLWPDIQQNPGDLNWTTLEALAPELRTGRTGWP